METNENTVLNNTENNASKKKDNKVLMGGIIAAVILVLAAGIGFGIYNSPSNRLSRQLDLGQKYLEEMDYEQAKIAFEEAIAIDEKCTEAYIGLTEAYIGMNEYDKALETAQKGYEVTGEEILTEYINMLQSGNITTYEERNLNQNGLLDDEMIGSTDENSNESQPDAQTGKEEVETEWIDPEEIQFEWSLDDWTINGIALGECDYSKVADSFGLDMSSSIGIQNWNGHEGLEVSFNSHDGSDVAPEVFIQQSDGELASYMIYEETFSEPAIRFYSFAVGGNGGQTAEIYDFSCITNVPYMAGDAEAALEVFKVDEIINHGELQNSSDDGRKKDYSFRSNFGNGDLTIETYGEEGEELQNCTYWLSFITQEHWYEVNFTVSEGACQTRYTVR